MTADLSDLHIAILSCNYGGGHQRVAEVLVDELRQRSPGCRVEIYDYIETCIGHWYNIAFAALYFGTVRWAPWLYRWFYRATSGISSHSRLQRCINGLGKRRLAVLLRTRRPDIVVCTYCLPAGGMSELKREGRSGVPCITVVTDHAIHSQWIGWMLLRYSQSSLAWQSNVPKCVSEITTISTALLFCDAKAPSSSNGRIWFLLEGMQSFNTPDRRFLLFQ